MQFRIRIPLNSGLVRQCGESSRPETLWAHLSRLLSEQPAPTNALAQNEANHVST